LSGGVYGERTRSPKKPLSQGSKPKKSNDKDNKGSFFKKAGAGVDSQIGPGGKGYGCRTATQNQPQVGSRPLERRGGPPTVRVVLKKGRKEKSETMEGGKLGQACVGVLKKPARPGSKKWFVCGQLAENNGPE